MQAGRVEAQVEVLNESTRYSRDANHMDASLEVLQRHSQHNIHKKCPPSILLEIKLSPWETVKDRISPSG